MKPTPATRRSTGFTLIEVAIAIALLAIALTAASRAANTGMQTHRELRDRTLAQWVARNRIAERLASQRWLAPGTYTGTESEAGNAFLWREQVSDSPNPALRRLDVSVASAEAPERVLARLTGFIALEAER